MAGSILTRKNVRLQTENMAIRGTKVTVLGMPVDICEDRIEAFFSKYGDVEGVNASISKSGIATGDIVLQVTLTRQAFGEIPNILMCREKRMLVVEVHVGPRGTWPRRAPLRIHHLHLTHRRQQ